jgi:hypothetical protein
MLPADGSAARRLPRASSAEIFAMADHLYG